MSVEAITSYETAGESSFHADPFGFSGGKVGEVITYKRKKYHRRTEKILKEEEGISIAADGSSRQVFH